MDQTHTTPTPEWIPVATGHYAAARLGWPVMLALGMVFYAAGIGDKLDAGGGRAVDRSCSLWLDGSH